MQSLFGWRTTAKPVDDETSKTVKALPASWYTSPDMFDLERRAIFSRKWILITHRQRLANVGDYVQTTVADYPIIVVKDRQGQIRAHHNVCRHRAYPLVEQKDGNVSILACKYHSTLLTFQLRSAIDHLQGIDTEVRLVIWLRRQTRKSSKVPRT